MTTNGNTISEKAMKAKYFNQVPSKEELETLQLSCAEELRAAFIEVEKTTIERLVETFAYTMMKFGKDMTKHRERLDGLKGDSLTYEMTLLVNKHMKKHHLEDMLTEVSADRIDANIRLSNAIIDETEKYRFRQVMSVHTDKAGVLEAMRAMKKDGQYTSQLLEAGKGQLERAAIETGRRIDAYHKCTRGVGVDAVKGTHICTYKYLKAVKSSGKQKGDVCGNTFTGLRVYCNKHDQKNKKAISDYNKLGGQFGPLRGPLVRGCMYLRQGVVDAKLDSIWGEIAVKNFGGKAFGPYRHEIEAIRNTQANAARDKAHADADAALLADLKKGIETQKQEISAPVTSETVGTSEDSSSSSDSELEVKEDEAKNIPTPKPYINADGLPALPKRAGDITTSELTHLSTERMRNIIKKELPDDNAYEWEHDVETATRWQLEQFICDPKQEIYIEAIPPDSDGDDPKVIMEDIRAQNKIHMNCEAANAEFQTAKVKHDYLARQLDLSKDDDPYKRQMVAEMRKVAHRWEEKLDRCIDRCGCTVFNATYYQD